MLHACHYYSQCAISGQLSDSLKAPIVFNAIGLLNANDSSIVKGVMTDDKGAYCFENIKKGTYQLKVSAIGFDTYYSNTLEYDSVTPITLPNITLKARSINLNEVSVAAQKKTIEYKNGNVIVNIEGTALAMGNTAYDLLSRLPGVTVSDGNISIQGKAGVKILIDGKLQQVSGQQLMNILKSMNSSQIDKMEVLKKPPVKYDAAGTGGMINIKTNKLKIVGFSGSVFGSYSQGFLGSGSGGFNLNYKGKKFNFFSGVTANKDARHFVNKATNTINYNGIETTVDQETVTKSHGHYETYNIGTDWFINKSNSIGIKINGAFGLGLDDHTTNTNISDNSLGYQNTILYANKPNPWIYPEFNLNTEHLFDTVGTALHFSADYKPYWDIYDANFNNQFIDATSSVSSTSSIYKTSNTLLFNTLSGLLDFEKELKHEFKIETGIKHSYQGMNSDYYLKNQDAITGQYLTNNLYSDVYDYTQHISAGYFNINKQHKKMSFQLGVRGENTYINTLSKSNHSGFNRQYFNLFPLASIDFKKSDNHNFSIAYNKRVNRPDYNLFNPFVVFNSALSSFQGNPNLKPEYSHDINFTYSYKTWMNHSFSYLRNLNNFLDYSSQSDTTKFNISSIINLKWAEIFNYNVFIQKDFTKWWTFNFNGSVFYINAKGVVNDKSYTINTVAFNPSIYSRFTLPKGFSIELNAWYLNPFLEGTYYTKSRSSVNMGIKKTWFDEKLSVSLAFNDIFFGEKRNTTSDYQNQHSVGYQSFDSRRVNLSLNYNFGKLKVEQRQAKDIDPPSKSGK
ncbi:MAG: TonB-dependent receptor [Bacteroidia bacterium]|nr:TonB-dependent receptor [Bacteroidia bacterium]